MKMIEFPKWKYHAELPAQIVECAEAELSLGEGWQDLPVVAGAEAAEEAPKAQEPKAEPAKRGRKPKAQQGEE